MHQNLVSPDDVVRLAGETVIVDCRFSLADPSAGRRAYDAGHLPHAVYADLEHDLSGPVVPGRTGRHPLPDPATFAARAGAWGIDEHTPVIAYDDAGGAMAARLWWLLRWLGHDHASVLDGGVAAWQSSGRPLTRETTIPTSKPFLWTLRPELVVDADDVERARQAPDRRVLDARAAERFRGENETIDPIAGHIPGARSLPFAGNLENGRMLPPDRLRARIEAALDGVTVDRAIVYCGSGVTAAHDVLAAEVAGLPGMRLYAGSWSEWITDSSRPVEPR
jgi:thiosulfate/3-mercaptopyruvate sulfurtransferase